MLRESRQLLEAISLGPDESEIIGRNFRAKNFSILIRPDYPRPRDSRDSIRDLLVSRERAKSGEGVSSENLVHSSPGSRKKSDARRYLPD